MAFSPSVPMAPLSEADLFSRARGMLCGVNGPRTSCVLARANGEVLTLMSDVFGEGVEVRMGGRSLCGPPEFVAGILWSQGYQFEVRLMPGSLPSELCFQEDEPLGELGPVYANIQASKVRPVGEPVEVRSPLELDFVARLERDPAVASFRYEPFRIAWYTRLNGNRNLIKVTTVPDFIVTSIYETVFVVEVKGRGLAAEYHSSGKCDLAREWAGARGWRFDLLVGSIAGWKCLSPEEIENEPLL